MTQSITSQQDTAFITTNKLHDSDGFSAHKAGIQFSYNNIPLLLTSALVTFTLSLLYFPMLTD